MSRIAVIAASSSVLCTLRKDGKQLQCAVKLLPQGLSLHMSVDQRERYLSRTFQSRDELLSWAEQEWLKRVKQGREVGSVGDSHT